MEGYSVTEAASILGVPTERVWELLARGVLAGTPEGESGMRVFLQPRPAPEPRPMDIPPPTNGGHREPAGELSPFRELLTEFRNLTERYGQALLALGEARGEVAALRSRVDLLEARMDLRLPVGPPAPAAAPSWPLPEERPVGPSRRPSDAVDAPRPGVEPAPATRDDAPAPLVESGEEATVVVRDDADDHTEERDDTEERPVRRRRQHHATEAFAEALARAEDPTRPELPQPDEVAQPLTAPRDAAPAAPQEADEIALPRELPGADEIPAVEEAAARDRRDEADDVGDVSEDEASEATEADTVDGAPEPAASAETHVESALPAVDESEAAHEVHAGLPAEVEEPAAAPAPEPVATEGAETESAEPAGTAERSDAVGLGPIEWDPQRYTAELGEPDWFAEEEVPPEPAEEPDPDEAAAVEAAVEAPVEAPGWPAEDTPEPAVEAAGTAEGPVDAEPAVPADDAGPAPEPATEPAAETPTDRGRPLPGAFELEEALAALDELAGRRPAAPPPGPTPDAPTPDTPMSARIPAPGATGPLARTPGTPASRAYRRLRRIFPG
jgi:hypothetical protein